MIWILKKFWVKKGVINGISFYKMIIFKQLPTEYFLKTEH
jgi:hypothetical protein